MNNLDVNKINKLDNELKKIYYITNIKKENINKKINNISSRDKRIHLIVSLFKYNNNIINYIILVWVLFIAIILICNIYYYK